jgi:hypothetical protein
MAAPCCPKYAEVKTDPLLDTVEYQVVSAPPPRARGPLRVTFKTGHRTCVYDPVDDAPSKIAALLKTQGRRGTGPSDNEEDCLPSAPTT